MDARILCEGGGEPQALRKSFRHRYPEWGSCFERWRWRCPYGMWTCADGRRILHNRDYLPLYECRPGKLGRIADPDEWVEDIVARERFFDGGNSPVSWAGVPAREWRPVVERINRLLVAWALPPLRPRPPKRASSPRTRRLWEGRERFALLPERVKALALGPRKLCDRHHITGKLRDYLLRGRPRFELRNVPAEKRWWRLDKKVMWMAYCLHERELLRDETFILLRESRWNRHRGQYGGDAKIWRVIEIAYSRPRRHPYGKGPSAKAPTPQGRGSGDRRPTS